MSVLHFGQDGAISIAGQVGDIDVSLRAVGRNDVRAQGVAHWLVITGIGGMPTVGADSWSHKGVWRAGDRRAARNEGRRRTIDNGFGHRPG